MAALHQVHLDVYATARRVGWRSAKAPLLCPEGYNPLSIEETRTMLMENNEMEKLLVKTL